MQTKNGYPAAFLEEDEGKCCKDTANNTTADTEDCIEVWKEKLKSATNEYTEQAALAEKGSGMYTEAYAWEMKLKKWWEDVKSADEYAREIINELNVFIASLSTINTNSDSTMEAAKALLGRAKEIFDAVHRLLQQSQNNTSNSEGDGSIQTLKTAVECYPRLDEQQKREILERVKAYEDKVKAVYELQKSALEKMLEFLDVLYQLDTALGEDAGQEGSADKEQQSSQAAGVAPKVTGLAYQLKNLRERLGQESTHEQKIREICSSNRNEDEPEPPPCNEVSKKGEDILQPQPPLFPISGAKYYGDIEKLYETAQKTSTTYRKERDKERSKRDKALALKTSYSEAVKAAEAAEAAK